MKQKNGGRRAMFAAAAALIFVAGGAMNGTAEAAETSVSQEAKHSAMEARKESLELPEMTDTESIEEARKLVWNAYLEDITQDETRKAEIEAHAMEYGEVTMKYGIQVIGEAGEQGYPVYIALHGGGQSDTPQMNDSQWVQMGQYYVHSVENGIYIFPRGVRDTWDCHFNPESYPLYDELIENMIAFCDADPNRVYLMGYSAGGDGVYAITPRMADRFAAANMSAGHPNNVSMVNLFHTPIQLQVGENDAAYNRNTVTAEYGLLLDQLQEDFGGEGWYLHNTLIHADMPHNFYDRVSVDQEVIANLQGWLEDGDETTVLSDANAVRWVSQYVRDPLPERVVWDLTTRADKRESESFYWLQMDRTVTEGTVTASYDREENAVTIESDRTDTEITVLISEEMLDVFSPVTVSVGGESYQVELEPDPALLIETTYERGDSNYQFIASLTVQIP